MTNKNDAKCVVISQPMYFPWYGLLEQIRHCDTFVYYDDVQFARGFFNRVQIKTEVGSKWLTVPLRNQRRGQLINEVQLDEQRNWRQIHRDLLKQAYRSSPYLEDVMELVDRVFEIPVDNLSELSIESTNALIDYFSLGTDKEIHLSSDLAVPASSTERLVNICMLLNASHYLTGHGARNYLEHELFEKHAIDVDYIEYGMCQYPQLNGEFSPYVSTLDLVANCGKEGIKYISGSVTPWKIFCKNYDDMERT